MSQSSLSSRQRDILELTHKNGFVTLDDLAARFDVSTQTVRRDVIALDVAGLLQRFHGGAGPSRNDEKMRLGRAQKLQIDVDEKQSIAGRAVALIPDHAAIFMDLGTTMESVAAKLNTCPPITIFTNSIPVAMTLDQNVHEVHLLGGQKLGRGGDLGGEAVLQRLSELHLDMAFIGCSAIDKSDRAMDFDVRKVAVKKAAMMGSDKAVLLATKSKFGRSGRFKINDLAAFDDVISGQ